LVLLIQLVFGAFMAGLKAAVAAPTWPTINGQWVPSIFKSGWVNDPLAIHFIHRGFAYLLVILVFYWWMQLRKRTNTDFLKRLLPVPFLLISVQVVLGIFTVLYATRPEILLWLGALHQFTAMLLLACWVTVIYLLSGKGHVYHVSA
jgi:cytochrome c oxidase assembly protein subunit 15